MSLTLSLSHSWYTTFVSYSRFVRKEQKVNNIICMIRRMNWSAVLRHKEGKTCYYPHSSSFFFWRNFNSINRWMISGSITVIWGKCMGGKFSRLRSPNIPGWGKCMDGKFSRLRSLSKLQTSTSQIREEERVCSFTSYRSLPPSSSSFSTLSLSLFY